MAVKYTAGPKIPMQVWRPLPPIAANRPPARPYSIPTFSSPRPPAPGAAPPAPGSPAPPAAPGGLALPPDPGYDQTVAGLERRRDDRVAALGQQRSAGLLTYGYREVPQPRSIRGKGTGAQNPAWAPGGAAQIEFDSANPFSQAAMMYRQWDQAREGQSNSMAARGHLYSGSFQNAQNEVAFGRQQGEDALQKAVASFLARNKTDRDETLTQFELDAGQAMGDRLSRIPDNPLYEPVIDGGPVAAATAAARAAARPRGAMSTTAASAVAAKLSGAKPKPKVKVKLKGSSGKYTMGAKKQRP